MLERITVFDPAFDKRDPDPKKNYGIHGVELRMVLKGPEGAVQFIVFTGWMLPKVQRELIADRLIKASHGVDFRNYLSESFGTGDLDLLEVNSSLEKAKRSMGMSNAPKLDPMDLEMLLPQPANVGFHSPKPMYEGQTLVSDNCQLLDGKPCYYDGSGLHAQVVYDILLKEGSEGVWKYLEGYYNRTFLTGEET